jgi:hypothetical protein
VNVATFPHTKDGLAQERILSELGAGRSASWRIPIYGDFEQLQEDGVVKEESFLSCMHGRGYDLLWSKAAFTAFDVSSKGSKGEGGLDQFQYLLAISALTFNRGSTDSGSNARWISIRQLVVYNVILLQESEKKGGVESSAAAAASSNSSNKENEREKEGRGISLDGFAHFLQVLSEAEESPHFYGIGNSAWSAKNARERSRDEEGMSGMLSGNKHRTSLELMDQSTMAESLAISKVQLATKQAEYEALELQYLKLEKQHCKLKLDLADEKAKKDT